MNLKRMVCASTLAAGIGVAGLLGTATGTAGADPGQRCSGPNAPACREGPQGGIDQGRQDHQPFDYNGQHVTPMPAGNGAGWGFWFLGQWIPL